MRVDLYSYHDPVVSTCTIGNPLGINKDYFLCEISRDEMKVGIPYEFWVGKVAKVRLSATTGNYGVDGSIMVESLYQQHTKQIDNDGNTYYEALYGSSLTLTASSYLGNKFIGWSYGVTTPTRTETITGDLTLTATFELAEYTITVYPSEGGRIGGYFEENGNTVGINNTTLTGVVKKGYSQMFVSVLAYDGYRFVGWTNGETSYELDFTFSSNSSFPADLFDETYTLILIPIFEKIEE